MKRLTVHLERVNKSKEKRNVKGVLVDKEIIRNTITFEVGNVGDANKIITNINEYERPRNNVKKWYLSNIR